VRKKTAKISPDFFEQMHDEAEDGFTKTQRDQKKNPRYESM